MKNKISRLAFTLIELLVVISIIAILAALAIPGITGALTKGQLIQAVSNARQIHLAVQTAALDKVTAGVGIGWPGNGAPDTGAAYATDKAYIQDLVANGAVKSGDLKIFTCLGYTPATDATAITANNVGYFIYNASESDDGNVVFLTTKNLNWIGVAPGVKLDVTEKGFGGKGCVIFHKGGDGTFYSQKQLDKLDTAAKLFATGGTNVTLNTKLAP